MIGTSLTHYRITAKLGEGGMGEVYRATDTKLGRDVAIKVLPVDFAENADRLRRFEQEAKTLATLNHPNIMTVFDVGEHEGQSFLVSELLEGQTLREVVEGASNRVLPARKSTDYALQIAQGLAAAHGKGVIHRDLKPDNIFVTKDGRVKILDFGLAKLGANPKSEQSKSAINSDAPTAMQAQTEPGAVMGTPGYMSPEQVKGIPVDHRSDIFSFGVILYELLSGRRAFRHDTAAETMRAILKEEPIDLEEIIPSALRQIVHHCLEKDPEYRFQSARDLSFSLSALSPSSGGSGSSRTPVLPARPPWRKPVLTAIAALALLAVGLALGRLLFPTPKAPVWSGVMLGGPEIALDPRPSPDGSLLAFQAFDRGLNQVAVMKPETGNWSVLTRSREHGLIDTIAWSADGASIYYSRRTGDSQGIYSVPVLGGEEHLVLDGAGTPQPLPDGTLLAVKLNRERQTQLFRFWPETGRMEDFPVITDIASSGIWPIRVDPIGKHAVIWGTQAGQTNQARALMLVTLDTGAVRPLVQPGFDFKMGTFSHDGQSILATELSGSLTRIVSIPVNGGTPQILFTVANMVWFVDSARDGSVYMSLSDRPSELVRRPLSGGEVEHIASFPLQSQSSTITVLPDSRTVLTTVTSGRPRLVLVEKGKEPVRLVSTAEETSTPAAAAGPNEVAFVIGPAPHQTIAIAEVASGRIARRIPLNKGEIRSLASSPDGATLYAAAGGFVWAIPSTGEFRKIRAGDSVTVDPSGRQLVIGIYEGSKFKLFRMSTDSGGDGVPEQEIMISSTKPLMNYSLSPNALNSEGSLLHPLSPLDSWFNAIGLVNTVTGKLAPVVCDDISDYLSMAWLPDGRIMAIHLGLRSTLWRFQPQK